MFGKPKKITASDILKMIADLPDEERDAVRSMLNNDSSEVEEQGSESAEESTEEESAEESTEEESVEESTESDSTEEDTGEETDAPEGEQESEDADTVEETVEESVEETVEESTESDSTEEDTGEETEPEPTDFEEIREALRSLAQRVDALTERVNSGATSDEDIGQPFGPDITEKSKNENDDLEKARRAAFGF